MPRALAAHAAALIPASGAAACGGFSSRLMISLCLTSCLIGRPPRSSISSRICARTSGWASSAIFSSWGRSERER